MYQFHVQLLVVVTYLSYDFVEDVYEDEVEGSGRGWIQADLEHVVIVRRYAEDGYETVDHEIHVLTHPRRTSRERLRGVEQ